VHRVVLGVLTAAFGDPAAELPRRVEARPVYALIRRRVAAWLDAGGGVCPDDDDDDGGGVGAASAAS
jgi:hypothetical protein